MSKLSRHTVICDLVANRKVASQEELRRLLYKGGHRVTQATLSRDIHELRLAETGEGYKLPPGEGGGGFLPSIGRPISAAIDAEEWDEVVGTIGGDDTILVIAHDARVAAKLARRIRGYFA